MVQHLLLYVLWNALSSTKMGDNIIRIFMDYILVMALFIFFSDWMKSLFLVELPIYFIQWFLLGLLVDCSGAVRGSVSVIQTCCRPWIHLLPSWVYIQLSVDCCKISSILIRFIDYLIRQLVIYLITTTSVFVVVDIRSAQLIPGVRYDF